MTGKLLSIREVRSAFSHLDELLVRHGEITITRRGKPIAKLVPIGRAAQMPSHQSLRASMPRMEVPSETLLRDEREAR